jgi:hypothetical protein
MMGFCPESQQGHVPSTDYRDQHLLTTRQAASQSVTGQNLLTTRQPSSERDITQNLPTKRHAPSERDVTQNLLTKRHGPSVTCASFLTEWPQMMSGPQQDIPSQPSKKPTYLPVNNPKEHPPVSEPEHRRRQDNR